MKYINIKNKKIYGTLLIVLFVYLFTSLAWANGPQWGRMPAAFMVGFHDMGSVTSTTLDSNFVFGTSGDAVGVNFSSPLSQTSGTLDLYAYCTATTGTTDLTSAKIYASATGSNDPQRPDTGSSPIATSGTVDASQCGTARWLKYSFTNLTLVESNHYFLVITNDEADPVSNTVSIETRGGLDSYTFGGIYLFNSLITTNGFTTDPTHGSFMAPMVIKFNDGTVMGMPFVTTGSHTSNTNYRGMRVNFDEDVSVGCVGLNVTATAGDKISIFQGSTVIMQKTIDSYTRNNISQICFPSVTLSGGLDYDVVINFTASTAAGVILTMGNSPPADVQLINPSFTHVSGATPGSFTEVTTSAYGGAIYLDNNPVINGASNVLGVIQ